MEKKDQIPQTPVNPEKESFEKYTRKNPNEISPVEVTPKQYGHQYGSDDAPDTRHQNPDVSEDTRGQQSREGYAANQPEANEDPAAEWNGNLISEDDHLAVADEEDLYEKEDVEENKSPLRPIDANRTPEEWKNLQQNQPDMVEDKRDYDAVSM